MPDLLGVLETSLYVEEFERACSFYEQVLGLNSIYRDQRLCAYDVGSRGVLLLFLRGRSFETVQLPGGTIPPHDGCPSSEILRQKGGLNQERVWRIMVDVTRLVCGEATDGFGWSCV